LTTFNSPEIKEIPFTLKGGRIILDANINGTQGKFMWDTGATWTKADIRVNNLSVAIKTLILTSQGITIKTKAYALNKITVGGVKLNTHSQVVKLPDHVRASFHGEGIDGLLGLEIFEGYWCEVSFSKQKIILYREKPAHFTQSVPAEVISRHITVPVMVDGERVSLGVDTGMPQSLRFPESILRQKRSDDYTGVLSNDMIKQYHLVKTKNIEIFDQKIIDKYILTNSFIPLNIPGVDNIGVVGLQFLANYDVLFDLTQIRDYKTTRVYYEPRIPPEERQYGLYSYITNVPPSGILNMSRRRDGAIVITEVIENGVAHTAFGLEPGIVVVKVNDTPVQDLSFAELASPDFSDTVKEITVLEDGVERVIMRE
jgi:hypothetical protein